ncbi:MAG: peptidase M15, partial [Mesorhizobium sp.]
MFSPLPSAQRAACGGVATTIAFGPGRRSLSEPEPRSAFNDPSGLDAASPRQAIAARPAGTDPAQAIG